MVFKHNWSEFDYDKDEDIQEYLKLLDKTKNEPDRFGLVYDEKITYPETAFGKTVFIRHIVWWETIGIEVKITKTPIYEHHYLRFSNPAKEEEVEEFITLLNKIKNQPDKYYIHPASLTKEVLIWGEVIGNGKENKHA